MGVSIGTVTQQLGLGIAFGVALGIVIASVVSKRAGSDSEHMLSEHVHELHKPGDWEEAIQRSQDHPVLILKHSTTCPTSASLQRVYGVCGHQCIRSQTTHGLPHRQSD